MLVLIHSPRTGRTGRVPHRSLPSWQAKGWQVGPAPTTAPESPADTELDDPVPAGDNDSLEDHNV